MGSSFSRSYGGILPSSLTTVLPIALVFSTCPPVSVWGTGTVQLARGFSWQHGISDFALNGSASRLRIYEGRICLDLSLRAYPRTTIAWAHLPSCVPSLLTAFQWVGSFPEGNSPLATGTWTWARTRWYRNINRLCIDYASRPRLSSRLTLGGLAFPRNPWAFGGGVSHPSLATHASILTRCAPRLVSTAASLHIDAPLPPT
jgi:hypothetical protein